jgi:hypothetical protein
MMVQRTLAARSLSHAQGGTVFAGYLKLLPIFLLVIPGMISRVLFTDEVACADPDICEAVCQNRHGCSNIAYPKLVLELMPTGLKGIMLSVMLAALMSDLTSIFNSASTLFTIDIYRYIRPKSNNRELMIIGRGFVIFMIGIGIIWIPVIQGMQGGQLYFYIQAISAYLAPPIACIYLFAVLWRRGNEQGAFWGLMVGLVLGVLRMILDFVYPEPRCGEVDNRPVLIGCVHYMYFALILFVITGITMVVVSAFSKAPDANMIIRTTFWTRHDRTMRTDPDNAYAPNGRTEIKETFIHGGRYLEMSLDVAAATNGMAHPCDASGDGIKDDVTENGLSYLPTKLPQAEDNKAAMAAYYHCPASEGNGATVVTPLDGTGSNTVVQSCNQRLPGKWYRLRHIAKWFCGLDESVQDYATQQEMMVHLHDLMSLKQNPRARAALYTALITLIVLDIFLYVFFSTGSDFGLLRDSPYNGTTSLVAGYRSTTTAMAYDLNLTFFGAQSDQFR